MAKGQRFQRMPESREASIWDVFQGEYPALTSWAAPTYQHWYPYPFGDPYAKEPGLSPMEKLQNPNARAAPASPDVPSFALARDKSGLALGGSEVGQPLLNPAASALGLAAGVGTGVGIEAGVDALTNKFGGSAPASTAPSGGPPTEPVLGLGGSEVAHPAASAPEGTALPPLGLGVSPGIAAGTTGPSTFGQLPDLGQSTPNLGVDKTVLGPSTFGQLPELEQPALNLGVEPSVFPFVGGTRGFESPTATGAITGTTPPVQGPNAEALAREAAAGTNESLMGANPLASLTTQFPFANLSPDILEAAGLPLGTSVVDFLSQASPELIEASGLGGLAAEGTSLGLSGVALPLTVLTAMISNAFQSPRAEGGLQPFKGIGDLVFGGRKTLAQRQAEERVRQAAAKRDILQGDIDVLTPNRGLDIPGIDVGNVADLSPDQMLASLDRANDVLWHQSWAEAGNDPLSPQGDVLQGQLYKKMLGLQDELANRGLSGDKIPAVVFGPKELRSLTPFEEASPGAFTNSEGGMVGGDIMHPGARQAQNRLQGANEETWTAAQALSWMNPAIDAEWARWKIQQEGGLAAPGQRMAQFNRILDSVPQGPANSLMNNVKSRLYAMEGGAPPGGEFAAAGLTEAQAREITGIGLPPQSQRQVDALLASLTPDERNRIFETPELVPKARQRYDTLIKQLGPAMGGL